MQASTTGLFILCVAIWGSTWLAITFQLGQVTPEVSVFYRFLLASLLVFAWCALRRLNLSFSRRRIGLPVWPALSWGMLYGSMCTLLVVLLTGKSLRFEWSAHYVVSLLYLAILGSVIAFAAYLTLLQRIGAARAGYIGVAVPVLALLLSTLFEGYAWRTQTWIGVAFAIAGNVVVLRRG